MSFNILLNHKVPENVQPERFRTYAQKNFTSFYPSNKSVKKAIEKGLFRINGKPADTARMVQPGDVVALLEESVVVVETPSFDVRILYEDEYCLVIEKPPGIPVHSHGKHNITQWLNASINTGEQPDKLPVPRPLHRLDAPTGGLLLVGKTRSFQVAMGKLFETRKVHKRYTALVVGKLEGKGEFNDPIDGKPAVSGYESLSYSSHSKLGTLTHVKLYPHTGRTHQLRIHCALAGHPILGERKYSPDTPNILGKGLFLYADELNFQHPITNKILHIAGKLPAKFSAFLAK